jgi:hypothetical protein
MMPIRPRNTAASSSEPVFNLRTVRPTRRSSAEWITVEDEELVESEALRTLRPAWNARRIVVRVVGYALIGALLWSMAQLVARPPIREAILNWTTFGMTRQVHAAAKHVEDFVARWRSR